MKLVGSSSLCQGRLEVLLQGLWHTVDSRSWGRGPGRQWDPGMASPLCQRLSCREALLFAPVPYFSGARNHIACHGLLGSFSHCNASEARQGEPLSLICLGGCPGPVIWGPNKQVDGGAVGNWKGEASDSGSCSRGGRRRRTC